MARHVTAASVLFVATGIASHAQSLATLAVTAPSPTFANRIVEPDLAGDERDATLEAKPAMFLQFRFSRAPMAGTDHHTAKTNLQLTRTELEWGGRLDRHFGVGLEFQLHPLLDGAPEEIVNDAFIEYYATRRLTIRVGQFIKPFGFDIQRSSSTREYPERAMFAGYFFPGQRDRGLMLRWRPKRAGLLRDVDVDVAALNGNRFWNDNDGRLDYALRVRKRLSRVPLAVGVSTQLGSQIVPPGSDASTNVRLIGFDLQTALGPIGLRTEWVHGTRPSTLLGLDPDYTTAFAPDTTTTGLAAAALVRAGARAEAYGRFDYLGGDPMTGRSVRAVDAGYRRRIGPSGAWGVSAQWKSAITANDDAVNTRVQTTVGVTF